LLKSNPCFVVVLLSTNDFQAIDFALPFVSFIFWYARMSMVESPKKRMEGVGGERNVKQEIRH